MIPQNLLEQAYKLQRNWQIQADKQGSAPGPYIVATRGLIVNINDENPLYCSRKTIDSYQQNIPTLRPFLLAADWKSVRDVLLFWIIYFAGRVILRAHSEEAWKALNTSRKSAQTDHPLTSAELL